MSDTSQEISAGRLKSFISRVEKLNEDKAAVADDLKEVYSESKSAGFDTKAIRKIVALRKVELEKRREEAEILDLYMSVLGLEQ